MIYPANHLQPLSGNNRILSDEEGIRCALAYAQKAQCDQEVPVGAVVTLDNVVIGVGWNRPIGLQDPTAHAEVQALRAAAAHVGNYRLNHTTLYVTLEPCAMCVGALIHARVARVVFGAFDLKAGAVTSQHQLFDHACFNHRVEWQGGVLQDDCKMILQDFFKQKRCAGGKS
jgi:tRNA(adenine34) deaminase